MTNSLRLHTPSCRALMSWLNLPGRHLWQVPVCTKRPYKTNGSFLFLLAPISVASYFQRCCKRNQSYKPAEDRICLITGFTGGTVLRAVGNNSQAFQFREPQTALFPATEPKPPFLFRVANRTLRLPDICSSHFPPDTSTGQSTNEKLRVIRSWRYWTQDFGVMLTCMKEVERILINDIIQRVNQKLQEIPLVTHCNRKPLTFSNCQRRKAEANYQRGVLARNRSSNRNIQPVDRSPRWRRVHFAPEYGPSTPAWHVK